MKLLLCVVFISTLAFGNASDPLGQKAHYLLDTNPERTSSLISSGTIDVGIVAFIAATGDENAAYQMKIDYKYALQFLGSKTGSETTNLDAVYFDPKFLADLRANGTYEGENFKAKHLGYVDAKTLNGKFYPKCDKVYLYDIKTETRLSTVLRDFLGQRADVEDMTAMVHIYPDVPVLGAVKLDVAGTYQGIAIKAGGDYDPKR